MAAPISNVERLILLGFALAISALCLAFFILDVIETEKLIASQRQSPFSIDVIRTPLAGFHFMTPIIFVALILSRKYIASTILTGLYGLFMIVGLSERLDGGGAFGGEGFYTDFFTEIFDKLHTYDFIAVFFILIGLIWQLTIIVRLRPTKLE